MLPARKYGFLESYCGDRKSDCRRVFINVAYLSAEKDTPKVLATIGYGWDTLEYYSRWFGRGKFAAGNSIVRDLKGPTLEFAGVYTEHSEKLLKFFKEFMLEDTTFTERLKAHYRLFKNFTHTYFQCLPTQH